MSVDRARHGRQIRLPEVGDAGQERLVAGVVVVAGDGPAAEIEAAYLAGAGVTVTRVPEVAAPSSKGSLRRPVQSDAVKALGIRDAAAREVAEGAMRALVAMRNLLGVGVA